MFPIEQMKISVLEMTVVVGTNVWDLIGYQQGGWEDIDPEFENW